MEYICRCGCKTFTINERRKHLRSKLHNQWQRQLEYISNNDLKIISQYKYIKEECQILPQKLPLTKNGMN